MQNQNEVISKEEAAIIQLNDAIELYYNGRYYSAITLAGAAEDILGRLAGEFFPEEANIRHDHASMTATMIALTTPREHSFFDLPQEDKEIIYKKEEKTFLKEWPNIRNQLKHKKDRNENFVECESFKQQAEFYISAAIINYKLYKGEYPQNEPVIYKYREDHGIYPL